MIFARAHRNHMSLSCFSLITFPRHFPPVRFSKISVYPGHANYCTHKRQTGNMVYKLFVKCCSGGADINVALMSSAYRLLRRAQAYGQGMTVAALDASLLQGVLQVMLLGFRVRVRV